MSADLTVSAAAKILKKRREAVVALLKSGALRGYECTAPGDKRKSYRIPPEALEDFKAGRSATQYKQSRRRAKAVQSSDFVEYF
ncbi:MAG: helix-turn-helix domain-containing protein [Planctomycetaceae bacterium]|nr:helix-turn-helix domain-containing protein [Planctomycetaceae bacterium]